MTFEEGQMALWEGPNCPKNYLLSKPRHRHNVKVLHRSEGAKS